MTLYRWYRVCILGDVTLGRLLMQVLKLKYFSHMVTNASVWVIYCYGFELLWHLK